jgi:hypothetical protein
MRAFLPITLGFITSTALVCSIVGIFLELPIVILTSLLTLSIFTYIPVALVLSLVYDLLYTINSPTPLIYTILTLLVSMLVRLIRDRMV